MEIHIAGGVSSKPLRQVPQGVVSCLLVFGWLLTGTTGEMSRERPWCRLGARSWIMKWKKTSSLRPSQPSHWNSSSLRPLRFEKFSERTIKAVRSCPSCLEMMRWLFGSSPFFSICKRLFRLWKSLKTDVDFVQAVMLAQEEAKKIQQAWHPVEHDKRH